MTLRALAFVGALVISSGLITPGTAEARHRHGYGCDHRRADAYYDRSPRYYEHGGRYRDRGDHLVLAPEVTWRRHTGRCG